MTEKMGELFATAAMAGAAAGQAARQQMGLPPGAPLPPGMRPPPGMGPPPGRKQ